jgi:hypothetical protein
VKIITMIGKFHRRLVAVRLGDERICPNNPLNPHKVSMFTKENPRKTMAFAMIWQVQNVQSILGAEHSLACH